MSVPVPAADGSTPVSGDVPLHSAGSPTAEDEIATIPISASVRDQVPPPAPDSDLLAAFVERKDPAALTAIVERYSTLVYRVALRSLNDRHLADDVFQATFLVLAQSARRIKDGDLLAAWLHGTARNLARRALTHKQSQRNQLAISTSFTRSQKGGEMSTPAELDPLDQLVRRHEQQLLDEELQNLPESSRAPLVLYYLEEKSQAEIAQLMGLTVEAVEGRLRRAKHDLRLRLIRRGVTLSGVVAAATLLTPSFAAAAPTPALISTTITAALGTAAGTSLAAASTTAATLATKEVAAMSLASKATAVVLGTAGVLTVTAGLIFGAVVTSMGREGAERQAAARVLAERSLKSEEISTELALVDEVPAELTQTASPPVDQPSTGGQGNAIAYQAGDFSPGQRTQLQEFVKSLGAEVAWHHGAQVFVIRANSETHQKISEEISKQRSLIAQEELLKLKQTLADRLLALGDEHPEVKELKAKLQDLESGPTTESEVRLEDLSADEKGELLKAVHGAVSADENPTVTDPDTIESRQYDFLDLPPGHLEKFVKFYKLHDKSVVRGSMLEINDSRKMHQEYANALDGAKRKREQSQLKESEFDGALADIVREYSQKPEQAQQRLAEAEKLLIDASVSPGIASSKVRELKLRVMQWQSIVDATKQVESGNMSQPREHSESSEAASNEELPTTVTADLNWAEKMFSSLKHDFGDVAPGSVHQHVIEITNRYKETVTLTAPESLCTCGTVTLDKTVLQSKEVAHLTITLDTDRFKGRRVATVTLDASIKPQVFQRVRIPVRANIEMPLGSYSYTLSQKWLRSVIGPEKADGLISNVDHEHGTVWLNIGKQQNLKPQITFSVYSKSQSGLAPSPQMVKARIEVVEVRETSSVARVVEEIHPIAVGDFVDSPAWDAQEPEHFALSGNADLNGDGVLDRRDRKILNDLLNYNGAVIDVEVTNEGIREPADGKLTDHTKWLVSGDVGDPASAVGDDVKLQRMLAVQKQHEMLVEEARELGIRIVALKDFLTYMGWKPASRVHLPQAENGVIQIDKSGASLTLVLGQEQNVKFPSRIVKFQCIGTLPREIVQVSPKRNGELSLLALKTGLTSYNFVDSDRQAYTVNIEVQAFEESEARNTGNANAVYPVADLSLEQRSEFLDFIRGLDLDPVYQSQTESFVVTAEPKTQQTVGDFFIQFRAEGQNISLIQKSIPAERPIVLADVLPTLARSDERETVDDSQVPIVARTTTITLPETDLTILPHDIVLLKFPGPVTRAEVQYDRAVDVTPVAGKTDHLRVRGTVPGNSELTATLENDTVHRVRFQVGTTPANRFRDMNPSEEKIRRALDQQVSLEFPDNTLKEVCSFITQLHSIPITIDTDALKAAGVNDELKVSLVVSGITLRSALQLLLSGNTPSLDYCIDNEVLVITTPAGVKNRKRLEYYHLSSLSSDSQSAAEKFITPLADSVSNLEGDLLVDGSLDVHRQLEEFLDKAHKLEMQKPARPVELASTPLAAPVVTPLPPTRASKEVSEHSPELVKVLAEWKAKSAGVRDFSGSFKRLEFDKIFATETRSQGRLMFERPDSGRIEFGPADAAWLQKPGRVIQNEKPYKIVSGEASTWLSTGTSAYVLHMKDKTYDLIDIPPAFRGRYLDTLAPHSQFGMQPPPLNGSYRFELGRLHNPDGSKRDAGGQAMPKAIHIVAICQAPQSDRGLKPVRFLGLDWPVFPVPSDTLEYLLDPDTYLPLNVRTLDPSGNKETVYTFDHSSMKINAGFGALLANPFKQPNLNGWKLMHHGKDAPAPAQEPPASASPQNEQVMLSIWMFETTAATVEDLTVESSGKRVPKEGFRKLLEEAVEAKKARTICEPSVVLPLGKSGEFLSGGEIPVPVDGDQTKTSNSLQFGTKFTLNPYRRSAEGLFVAVSGELSTPYHGENGDNKGADLPTVEGRIIRAFVMIPASTHQAIVGPIWKSERMNSSGEAEMVGIYLWIREDAVPGDNLPTAVPSEPAAPTLIPSDPKTTDDIQIETIARVIDLAKLPQTTPSEVAEALKLLIEPESWNGTRDIKPLGKSIVVRNTREIVDRCAETVAEMIAKEQKRAVE